MIKRTNKFPAGKEIGGDVYAHKAYEKQFPGLAKAKAKLPGNFVYNIVKYSLTTREFSFIISSDFDTNPEPSVEGGIKVGAKGLKAFKNAGWIYHHKWLFVTDDYSGFDVKESKKRSEKWTALSNVDKSRIGQRAYWETNVLSRIK